MGALSVDSGAEEGSCPVLAPRIGRVTAVKRKRKRKLSVGCHG